MKHSIIDDILYANGQSTNIACSEAEEEFWARIKELESQVNHWKSNHDNQKTLKSQLMDRPDLKDRAASIQKLQEQIQELTEDRNSWRERSHEKAQEARLTEYYSGQIARIQEQDKKIEELQDVANHTKRHNDYLIVQNEDLETRNRILIETGHWIGQDEAHDLKVAVENFLAEPFFGPQEYRNLREALNACNPHRGSNFDDFLKEDSENRD